MSKRAVWAVVLGTSALLGVAGCDRTYLTPSYGRAYRQAFAVQTANPGRHAEARAVYGLDSQEASIIAGGYRKALSAKDDSNNAQSQQLLMVGPKGGRDSNLPPPSVP